MKPSQVVARRFGWVRLKQGGEGRDQNEIHRNGLSQQINTFRKNSAIDPVRRLRFKCAGDETTLPIRFNGLSAAAAAAADECGDDDGKRIADIVIADGKP